MGLMKCSSNASNPQSNAILEQIHQVLADGLVTFDLEGTYINEDKEDPFDEYLTTVLYAIRSSYHQSHDHLSAQLVFGRDMSTPVSTDIDWNAIRANKQRKIDKNDTRENSKQIPHTYLRDNYITLKKPGILQKLAITQEGLYTVMKHKNNGSIVIERAPAYIKNISMYEGLLHTIVRLTLLP